MEKINIEKETCPLCENAICTYNCETGQTISMCNHCGFVAYASEGFNNPDYTVYIGLINSDITIENRFFDEKFPSNMREVIDEIERIRERETKRIEWVGNKILDKIKDNSDYFTVCSKFVEKIS